MVARALVLLVLLGSDHAPLVVDRTRRDDYITALEAANDGDLSVLVGFFAELETDAMRSQLGRLAQPADDGAGAVAIAQAFVARLRGLQVGTPMRERRRSPRSRRTSSGDRSDASRNSGAAARGLRRDRCVRISTVMWAAPPDERARYWRSQIARAARSVDFPPNWAEGSWWTRLRVLAQDQELRYVVAVQKVGGGETGVLAVTAFAELIPSRADEDGERAPATRLFDLGGGDSVTLIHTDGAGDRWPEVAALVEKTPAAATLGFSRALG